MNSETLNTKQQGFIEKNERKFKAPTRFVNTKPLGDKVEIEKDEFDWSHIHGPEIMKWQETGLNHH
jgi:hypothetical protein